MTCVAVAAGAIVAVAVEVCLKYCCESIEENSFVAAAAVVVRIGFFVEQLVFVAWP